MLHAEGHAIGAAPRYKWQAKHATDAAAECDHMGEAAQHDLRDKSGDVSSKEVDIEISLSLDDT